MLEDMLPKMINISVCNTITVTLLLHYLVKGDTICSVLLKAFLSALFISQWDEGNTVGMKSFPQWDEGITQ